MEKLLKERPVYQTHSETNGAMKRKAGLMSYRLKLIIFVLAINIMALAVGYLMRGWAFTGLSLPEPFA